MNAKLSARIKQPGLISSRRAVFELISARIADGLGFDALYMTGYGTVASNLGVPDAGIATYTRHGRAAQIAGQNAADRRRGHRLWRPAERAHTVRGYEAAGVTASRSRTRNSRRSAATRRAGA